MATYRNGFMGPFIGKLGTAVGTIWRGVQVLKALPAPSTKPPTQRQLDQNARFALVTDFLGKFSYYVKLGYQVHTKGATPMNVAVKYHIDHAVTGNYPDYRMDYANVRLTDANSDKIDEVQNPRLSALPEYQIKVDWDVENIRQFSKANDKLVVIFYSDTKEVIMGTGLTPLRSDKSVVIDSSRMLSDAPLHGWAFFVSNDEKTVSASVYLGSIQTVS